MNRYIGAKSFEQINRNIFFGRDSEVKELINLVLFNKIVVLHSKSGLGKTSLVNAKLIPILDNEIGYKPLYIRLYSSNGEDTALDKTKAILKVKVNNNLFLGDEFPGENSIWYWIKNQQIQSKTDKYLLIFDQFEELFTYPQNEIVRFKKELSELMNVVVPQRMLDMVELSPNIQLTNEQEEFLHKSFSIKCLFAIRSDRLHLLDRISDYLPEILSSNYELHPLSIDGAKDAIVKPALAEGNFGVKPFQYSSTAVDAIISFLKDEEERVEAIQLQLICQSLEEKVEENSLKQIKEQDLGDLEQVIGNYYENRIKRISNTEKREIAKQFIENGLVIEETVSRIHIHESQVQKFYPDMDKKLLKELIDAHLIRAEESIKGGFNYELSHDTLVPTVLKSLEQRRIREKEKEKIKALHEKIEQDKKEREQETIRRKLKQRNLLMIFGSITTLLSIFAITIALKLQASEQQLSKKKEQLEINEKQLIQKNEELEAINRKLNETDAKDLLRRAKVFISYNDIEAALELLKNANELDSNNKEVATLLEKYLD